jgi:hypothetical protein
MARTLIACALLLAVGTATADDKKAAPAKPAVRDPSTPLDLRPPNITDLFSAQEIALIIAKTFSDDIEGVEVRGQRIVEPSATPDVWGGLAAPFWALVNPTQAWRILAPLPPDQIRRFDYEAPRATDTFVEPAAANPATAPIGPP